jgi:dUTP pyrophosphatase
MLDNFYLNVELVHPDAKLPTRANSGDAGLDFYTPVDVLIHPRKDILIPLGLKTEFPEGYVLIFAEKSGIATKKKLDILAKVIDSGYRGIVHAHLYNNSDETVMFKAGEKVVQGIVLPCWGGQVTKVNSVTDNSTRGAGGFGSSGK